MKIKSLSTDYPEFLKIISTIADPPKRLWYIGNMPETRRPTVAVIGTRKVSNYGREVAHHLCVELAKHGVIIVSGLALGIDAIAHRAALEAGGTTVAIMAGGLDDVYPRTHAGLARDILQGGGMFISEYPPGITPRKHHFIARNRLVSGMSDAVLVVEAGAKSGTMHTAGFALDQGKSVMAVPGNITSTVSEGCNNLIKRGALAVTSAQDVLDELGLFAPAQTILPLGATPEETALLKLILGGERDGDALQKQSGLAPALFSQTLTMLEISGAVRALGANRWALK